MRKDREEKIDPSQPALVVTYGNTTRKHRPLAGDLVVIGRSSCCDIGLVSPEVAPIHCVLVKIADGWRVRDCTGRSGTRVNGKSVTDIPLTDGDALQIGTFSFQLHLPRNAPTDRLPPPPAPTAPVGPSQQASQQVDEATVVHLRQSRERLARLALNLRRRLRDYHAAPPPAAPIVPSRFDAELGGARAELEQREKKLRFWEKELTEQDRSVREEYADIEHQRRELQRFAQETLARQQVDLEQKAAALLAEQRAELESGAELRVAQLRAELDQLAERLHQREHDLEQERRRLEENVQTVLTGKQAELSASEEALQQKQRDLDEQLKQVEAINAELAAARAALSLETADTERMRAAARLELETEARETEDFIQVLWQQCEAHRRRVLEKHGPIVGQPDAPAPTPNLDVRSRELEAYARHLRRTRDTLTQYEQDLSEAYQQFHAEYDAVVREAQAVKDRAVKEAEAFRQSADTAHGEPQPNDVLAAAALLDEQHQETEQVRSEFAAQLAEERDRFEQAEALAKSLQTDLTELRHELRQREEVLEQLKAELKQREEKLRPASVNGEILLAAPERLLVLVEKLQTDVVERDDRIQELQRSVDHLQQLTEHYEKESYEAELNSYRSELEEDRTLLNEEIARLDLVRTEMEEARQEAELHVSRERVQIASEWTEINRIREQLRNEHAKQEQPEVAAPKPPAKGKPLTKNETVEMTPPAPQDLIGRLRPASKQGLGLRP